MPRSANAVAAGSRLVEPIVAESQERAKSAQFPLVLVGSAGLTGRSEPRVQAMKYLRGLLAQVGRKNGWQLAEAVGDAIPDRMQRLLYRSEWEADGARDLLQQFVLATWQNWKRRKRKGPSGKAEGKPDGPSQSPAIARAWATRGPARPSSLTSSGANRWSGCSGHPSPGLRYPRRGEPGTAQRS